MCVSFADTSAAWDKANAARKAADAFDRRGSGLFSACWVRSRSNEDLEALYQWVSGRLESAMAASAPFLAVSGPEASLKFWLISNRISALLKQKIQVGREKRSRIGMSF